MLVALYRGNAVEQQRLMRLVVLISLFAASAAVWWPAHAARIKEVASVQGVRSNQLAGYGLVVGLDGTGDQTTQMPYTSQGMSNYLQQLGLTLPADAKVQMKNVAAVLVTAQLRHHGPATVAAYGIAARLEFLVIPVAFGIGSALTAGLPAVFS